MADHKKLITSNATIYGIQALTSSAYIHSTRHSLNSVARIIEPRSSIICDGFMVDEILDEFGTQVILRVVSKSFPDEYGDAAETYTDYSRFAVVQSYSASDEEVKEGIFNSGEVVFTFKKEDETLVKPGVRVKYGPTWYEIRSIDRQPLVDILYYLTARVQKI